MSGPKTYWLRNAKLLENSQLTATAAGDPLHRAGLVRIVTGPDGTEIRWSTAAPSYASLFYVMEWLLDLPAPYMLRYFLSGWFEESVPTAGAARQRLQQIVARSDVHLLQRTFVRECDPTSRPLPQLIARALRQGVSDFEPQAVDCVLDEVSGRFRVAHIGPQSAIARLWGLEPVSFPCQPGGSYDMIVSQAYRDVLRTGRPRYDHVLAAMVTPDESVIWIPYQRVVARTPAPHRGRGIRVVSEIAQVDIQII